MDKKDPIPFNSRKRQKRVKDARTQSRYQQPPRRPTDGALDDVRAYWTHFIRAPFAGPGRFYWTERMLWGNAVIAGILSLIGTAIVVGFAPLTLISYAINAVFVFFVVYYLMTWVINWILIRMGSRQHFTDALRLEMIVLSGWLVVVSLVRLVPIAQPLLYDAAILVFGILTLIAVHRVARVTWTKAILSSLGGAIAVILLLMILQNI